ncbi:RIB43A-like with coiled-coils protein 2 [Parambassis ranga]|uniref:RIB43A-like with coiled-coils protein 2 n=1 Tax=Parambassis ranga TaxID=210632 RepID=A0A6P7ITC0_9TELE|nr:RIB43A-like with coiled-coils protein 2 [Parambassis ranga]
MFINELPSERIARLNLEKRRNNEAERRERIFNEKVRTIGIDKDTLDMQVKEKKKQEEDMKKEEDACDADVLRDSKTARILQQRQVKEKREMEKDIVTFRRQYQQPEHRQEFDLNDPDRSKKTDQCDAQMMLPGLVGEEPESEIRLQRQKEQLREWLLQQQNDQAAERHQQKLEEQHCDQSRADMENEAMQLKILEMEKRKAAVIATKDYNLAMVEEKRRQQADVDTECAPSVVGVLGLNPSSDRRLPPESPQQIVQFQKYQIDEKKRIEFEKKQEEERVVRFSLDLNRTALLRERQQARLKKQQRQHLDSTNVQLAQTHKQQDPDIKRGYIDDSFFSKFNTCSR